MVVNGKNVQLDCPCTLTEYLKIHQYRLDCIAVEINGNIIPKINYNSVMLQENDKIEIVSFVGGG